VNCKSRCKSEWVYMPHAAHLIVGHCCRFHIATAVGPWLVSTVGEYLPSETVQNIFAASRGISLTRRGDAREHEYLEKVGWEPIGYERTYETMVFRAVAATPDEASCCPYRQANGNELEMRGYNDPGDAYRGHMEMCEKWAAVDEADVTTEAY
jgi:hypothetical protein